MEIEKTHVMCEDAELDLVDERRLRERGTRQNQEQERGSGATHRNHDSMLCSVR